MRAWFTFGVGALFVFYTFMLQASTSVMTHELTQAFAIDAAGIGFLSASFFYPYVVLQMPAGYLIDHYGARIILSVSMIGFALMCWVFATTHKIEVAEISRMLMGVMGAGSVVGALFLAANWFPLERFALLAGLMEMMGMFGGAVGQNILAMLVTHLGWRETMLICAFVVMALAILVIGWVFDGPQSGKKKIGPHETHMLKEFWQILRIPQVWLVGIFGGLIFAMLTGFAALWSVPYLMQLYQIPLVTAAAASSMVFWGAAFGSVGVGWIVAHFGKRRLVMQIGTLVTFVLSLILFYVPGIALSLMFLVLFAIGLFCGIYVLAFSVVCEIVPQHLRGTAMGFTNMMCILFGAPLFQPIIGWLLKIQQHEHFTGLAAFSVHNYQVAFTVLPLGLLLAFVSIFFIHEKTNTNRS